MTDLQSLYPDDIPQGRQPAPKARPSRPDTAEAVLYPDDRPAGQPARQPARPQPAGRDGDAPSTLTYDDAAGFDGTEAASMFNQRALAAQQDGNGENASEWLAAGQALVGDMKAAGTPADDFSAALRAFNEADSETLAPEQHAERYEASMAQLQAEMGPNLDADLALARQLIERLDRQAPGLIEALEATGAGNDPRLIKLAIKEARRRYGRGK